MSSMRSAASLQLRIFFEGWAGGFSTYAYGLFTSYLVFSVIFGSLYSLSNLFKLAVASFTNPAALALLLIQFYVISYFAIPLGMAFRILWEDRRNQRTREITTAIIAGAALIGLVYVTPDVSTYASLAIFSTILIWLLWRESRVWGEHRHKPFAFWKALAVLYCTFFAILFIVNNPPIGTMGLSDLFVFIGSLLLTMQATALLFTLVAAPVLWLLARQERPRTIWFTLIGLGLLSIVSIASNFILQGAILIAVTAMLYYRYNNETIETFGEVTPIETPTSTLTGSTAGTSTEPMHMISAALRRLADEAEFLREERTGEVLRVRRQDHYALPLERIVRLDGFEKSIGINHYLISSRTGHGKTTLVRNLVNMYGDYGFLIMDRHDEYEGQVFQLDKEFEAEKFENIYTQLPSSQLSSGPNMLRDAQVYNVEQQFDRLIKESLRPKVVEQLFSRVYSGGRVILRPGKLPDFIYTRISHAIISEMFETGKRMKRDQQARLRIVIINEEAQNSYNVDEQGEERDRNHPLLKIVHEGRKYGVAIINVTSNPENIPRTIKDNSLLVLGSIGTPAIKRLVGEKLGMIYVRYIYELPIGDFFLDTVDKEGNYIIFPDHFGRPELIDVIKT